MNPLASADATPRRINPWRLFTGAMIPNWLLCRSEVSAGAKLCYARLAQFAGRDGLCFPKQATLAGELGISDRTVRNHLRELEEFQLLEVDQPGLKKPNSYAFLAHSWMDSATPPDRQGCSGPDRKSSSAPDWQESSGPIGEENQKEENQRDTHTAGSFVGPTLAEVEASAAMHGIQPEAARTFFHEAEAVGWVSRHGHPIRNWQSALKAYGEKWRAVDHRRATVAAARSPAPPKRRGAFATVAPAAAFTSTEI